MNQKIDNKLLKKAIKAVNTAGIEHNGIVSNEFNGYISSFGATVVQAGLLPAIVFFESDGNSQKERKAIIEAIKLLVDNVDSNKKLYLQLENMDDTQLFQKEAEILEAAVALKMAIRTYKLEKS